MIEFDCSECGARFEVEDAMAGKEVMCTECGSMSVVSPTQEDPASLASQGNARSHHSVPYVSPRPPRPPLYLSLRIVASLHFIFGAVCFIGGGARLTWLVYRRWVKDMAFYIRGPTLLRTFAIAAVGLFLMGMGALLHYVRDSARRRSYERT